MINIIISVKGLQKISDRLRVCIAKFITILYITKFIITNDCTNKGGVTQLDYILIIIIIILLKEDFKIQLTNNKIQMASLTRWLVVG